MFFNQIFVTPTTDDTIFNKYLRGFYTREKPYPVFAIGEDVEKILLANDQGKLCWEYFDRFRVYQTLTRVISQDAITDQIIELAQQKAIQEPKVNPLLDTSEPKEEEIKETKETEVKQTIKKGVKNG